MASEQWCYQQTLTTGCMGEVKKTEVLKTLAVKEPPFYRNTARLKMVYTGNVLTGRRRINVVLMLKGKINGVKT